MGVVEYLENYFKMQDRFLWSGTVVVVEDSKLICDVINNFVASAGLNVVLFNTAEEGLGYIKTFADCDVILVDINLPKMNGLELIREIRNSGFQDLPIVAMTTNAKETTLVRSFLYGANDYIQKPFHRDELIIRLKSLIKLGRFKKEIVEKNDFLESLNKTKNDFPGMAAHDLRNPITTIRNSAELMSRKPDTPAETIDILSKMILDESGKMLKLLDDLLIIHKHDTSGLDIRPEKLDINMFFNSIISGIRLAAEKKDINIRLESLSPNRAAVIDPTRISQVVENYLTNVIKYFPAKTTVQTIIKVMNKNLRFEVIDEGQGIDEKEREKVFQKYSRISTKPTAGESSTGLGLSICKSIIEAHGGQVGYSSTRGKGSRFYFDIPDCVVPVDEQSEPEEDS